MTRQIKEFESYGDFYQSAVSKQCLASLCVNVKKLLTSFEDMDSKFRDLLVDGSQTDIKNFKLQLQELRQANNTKVLEIIGPIFEKRNEGMEQKLPEWKRASDIFMNLTEGQSKEDEDPMVNELKEKTAEIDRLRLEIARIGAKEGESARTGTNGGQDGKEPQGTTTVEKIKSKGTFKLDAKTPVFRSNHDENVEMWIWRMEQSMKLANVPEDLWVVACSNYVEGIALEMVVRATIDDKPWSKLKEDLVKTFRGPHRDYDLRSKMLTLRDTGSFDKYLREFRLLSNQIADKDMTEKDRLTCFLQGLRNKTRVELFIKDPQTIEDAILLATRLESIRNSSGKVNEVSYAKVGKNTPIRCFICKKTGHLGAKCNRSFISNNQSMSKQMSNTQQNRKFNERGSVEQNKQKKDLSQIECFSCGKKGHYSTKCRSAKKNVVSANIVEVNMVDLFEDNVVDSEYSKPVVSAVSVQDWQECRDGINDGKPRMRHDMPDNLTEAEQTKWAIDLVEKHNTGVVIWRESKGIQELRQAECYSDYLLGLAEDLEMEFGSQSVRMNWLERVIDCSLKATWVSMINLF